MSLFKAREWWQTKAGNDEEFDQGLLCVANIDNAPDKQPKIIVGSFQGMLRIYAPRQQEFHPEDLMLEIDLGLPILQIEAGMFLPDIPQALGLAVLHPRKLVVFAFASKSADSADGAYMQLGKQYEHVLERNAHSFTFGPFGGVYGKDYICVQSMDGQLSFFEQTRPAFSRYLPNFILPGPLCYVPKIDALLTYSSRMSVEAYKYQVLAAAQSDSKPQAASAESELPPAGPHSGKRVVADWSISIGEQIIDMRVGRVSKSLSSSQIDILLLGEHHLFCITETGTIRQQKRFHCIPSCMCVYQAGADVEYGTRHNILLGAYPSSLMVFRELQLLWSAKMMSTPVAIRIAQFCGVSGMIVTLDDTGNLRLSYLGTDAATKGVANAEGKELDYEAMNAEHKQLQQTIREAMTGQHEPQETLVIRSQIGMGTSEMSDDGPIRLSVGVRLALSYNGGDTLENISVSCKTYGPFACSQPNIVIPAMNGGSHTPVNIPLTYRACENTLPGSLTVIVVAAYTTGETGQPRAVSHEFTLPLALVCRLVPPIKNATYKITLETNRDAVPLSTLFDDVLLASPSVGPEIRSVAANVLSFKYLNGDDVTILVSKTAGRYRLQSDRFEALWLLSSELARRLIAHFGSADAGGAGQGPFQLQFTEPLPLLDFFALVDQHLSLRQTLSKALEDLEQRAQQFRVVQKRLLIRFKDKTPNPLSNLPALLDATYQQIMDVSHSVETIQQQLAEASNRLSCGVRLVNLLIRYRFELNDAEAAVMEHHLSPEVDDILTQGWEERVDAALMQLLRTVLAKSARDTSSIPGALTLPTDASRLKKHIQLVCERLSKGMKLIRPKEKKPRRTSGSAQEA